MTTDLRGRLSDLAFRACRLGFRVLPVGESMRKRLRRRFLDRYPGIAPLEPRGQSAGVASPHRALSRADARAIGASTFHPGPLPSPLPG